MHKIVVVVAVFTISWKTANAWQSPYDGFAVGVSGVDVLAILVVRVLLPIGERRRVLAAGFAVSGDDCAVVVVIVVRAIAWKVKNTALDG